MQSLASHADAELKPKAQAAAASLRRAMQLQLSARVESEERQRAEVRQPRATCTVPTATLKSAALTARLPRHTRRSHATPTATAPTWRSSDGSAGPLPGVRLRAATRRSRLTPRPSPRTCGSPRSCWRSRSRSPRRPTEALRRLERRRLAASAGARRSPLAKSASLGASSPTSTPPTPPRCGTAFDLATSLRQRRRSRSPTAACEPLHSVARPLPPGGTLRRV